MSPDQGKAAADMLATVWEGEFPATCAVIAAVKDDNRSYKPDPKSRTAWELATHLATADVWFVDSITKGAFEWNPDAAKQAESQFKSVNDIVTFYKKTFPEKLAALRALPAEKSTETLDFFGMMKMSRAQFVGFANNHSIHHRGQLSLMCRLAGGEAPGLYGPNREETAAMRAAAPA